MYARVRLEDKVYNETGILVDGASQFICDSEADIALLQEQQTNCQVGSTAMVIPTGNVYMLSPSKVWTLYKGVSMVNA